MRILITGGCGFLGSHLVEHFLKNTDAELVILDKLSTSASACGFDRLRDVRAGFANSAGAEEFKRVSMLTADLGHALSGGVLREIGQVDYIVHAAAESHVDNSIIDPLPFLQSNVIGTHNLLMAARLMDGLKRIFVVSTDEVYGPAPFSMETPSGTLSLSFDESSRFRPANPYAAAKAGGEMVAMAYANTYKLPVTIVNTMNLIGERQHPEKFVPLVIRKVLAGEKVTIHADSTCTRAGTRFYLHCRTFANALGWLIDEVEGGPVEMPLKVHVCGEREISNLDLAQMIARLVEREGVAMWNPSTQAWQNNMVGIPVKFLGEARLDYELVDFHSSRPGHDLRYAMDDSMIRNMGWVRPMNLEQSLEKTVRWYLANPRWLALN